MPDTTYILGAGSLGLLYTAKLARSGRVGLLTKPEHCHLFSLGINYKSSPSTISKKIFVRVISHLSEGSKIHRLILATKAGQAAQALSSWLEFLADDAQILMLQNGMGSQAEVAQLLQPKQSLIVASVAQAAYLEEPNLVVKAGQGVSQLGFWQGPNPDVAQQWLSRFTAAGLDYQPVDNIRLALWHKLAVNAVINPLTALYQVENGALAGQKFRPLVAELVAEINELFKRLGIEQPAGGLANRVDDLVIATAQNHSSMCQDLRQGKITEIEYITGSLLRAAKAVKLKMPQHEILYNQIKRIEAY